MTIHTVTADVSEPSSHMVLDYHHQHNNSSSSSNQKQVHYPNSQRYHHHYPHHHHYHPQQPSSSSTTMMLSPHDRSISTSSTSSSSRFSVSNWSVNLLSSARECLNTIAHTLALPSSSSSASSSSLDHFGHRLRRRGSWSPEHESYLFPAPSARINEQYGSSSGECSDLGSKGMYMSIYSIEHDKDYSMLDGVSGSGPVRSDVTGIGFSRSVSFSSNQQFDRTPIRRHSKSMRCHSSSSRQQMNMCKESSPSSTQPPILSGFQSTTFTTVCPPRSSISSGSGHGHGQRKASTNSIRRHGKTRGSLESVDFDEEDDDDDEVSASSSSSSSSSSASSSISYLNVANFVPSNVAAIVSNIDDVEIHPSSPSPPVEVAATLNQQFAQSFGYVSLDEIQLYNELCNVLTTRAANRLINNDVDSSSTDQQQVQQQQRRGCSKSVARFGLGYEDRCLFPLVMPVFLNELPNASQQQCSTWDSLKLQADAELCRWEMRSLQNLCRRFPSGAPVTGPPSENVCPDPNLYLRNLCYQLVTNGGNFRSMAGYERNRALKRWNSTDDLLGSTLYNGGKGKLEPEFIGAKSAACRQSIRSSSSNKQQSRARKIGTTTPTAAAAAASLGHTDDSLVMVNVAKQTTHWISKSASLSPHSRKRGANGEHLTSMSSRVASNGGHQTNTKTTSSHHRYQPSSNLLFKEMSTLIAGSSEQFARYITMFYLEQFQQGFDAHALAQLVLIKDISSVDPNISVVNRKLRQTLLNLLSFDDTVVAVIGAYLRRTTSSSMSDGASIGSGGDGCSISKQAHALAAIIEVACLLRQLHNFYALQVVMGALQTLPVYSMTTAWAYLKRHMPIHFRDYKYLCNFSSKLANSSTLIGTNRPHIPTLSALLNRLRLCVAITWDLFEAKRRFIEHPSIAGWLHTEVLFNHHLQFSGSSPTFTTTTTNNGISSSTSSSSSLSSSSNVTNRAHHHHHQPPQQPQSAQPLSWTLELDPVRESFLTASTTTTIGGTIRLLCMKEFPINWSQRYVPSLPDRYIRVLLSQSDAQFVPMVNCFFRAPIEQYRLKQ